MAWDKGFDFRGSSSYVTDPTDCTYAIDADNYPTTRNGATFGEEDEWFYWLDRDSSVDARLAGLMGDDTHSTRWRLDLPATGDFDIRLAIGDAASSQQVKILLKDDVTTLDTYNLTTSAAKRWFDATGTEYTDATWPGSNTAIRRTFASTILRLHNNPSSSTTTIAHLFVSQVSAASAKGHFYQYYRGTLNV